MKEIRSVADWFEMWFLWLVVTASSWCVGLILAVIVVHGAGKALPAESGDRRYYGWGPDWAYSMGNPQPERQRDWLVGIGYSHGLDGRPVGHRVRGQR